VKHVHMEKGYKEETIQPCQGWKCCTSFKQITTVFFKYQGTEQLNYTIHINTKYFLVSRTFSLNSIRTISFSCFHATVLNYLSA
jgi:hypothetical protein